MRPGSQHQPPWMMHGQGKRTNAPPPIHRPVATAAREDQQAALRLLSITHQNNSVPNNHNRAHINNTDNNNSDSNNDNSCCGVCRASFSNNDRAPPVFLPCIHAFCSSCLSTALQKSPHCPTCRSYATRSSIIYLPPNQSSNNNNNNNNNENYPAGTSGQHLKQQQGWAQQALKLYQDSSNTTGPPIKKRVKRIANTTTNESATAIPREQPQEPYVHKHKTPFQAPCPRKPRLKFSLKSGSNNFNVEVNAPTTEETRIPTTDETGITNVTHGGSRKEAPAPPHQTHPVITAGSNPIAVAAILASALAGADGNHRTQSLPSQFSAVPRKKSRNDSATITSNSNPSQRKALPLTSTPVAPTRPVLTKPSSDKHDDKVVSSAPQVSDREVAKKESSVAVPLFVSASSSSSASKRPVLSKTYSNKDVDRAVPPSPQNDGNREMTKRTEPVVSASAQVDKDNKKSNNVSPTPTPSKETSKQQSRDTPTNTTTQEVSSCGSQGEVIPMEKDDPSPTTREKEPSCDVSKGGDTACNKKPKKADTTEATSDTDMEAEFTDNEEEEEEEKTQEEEEEESNLEQTYPIGTIVHVPWRARRGCKPGGVGRVTKVTKMDDGKKYYNVNYVLGGSEKNVEAKYVTVDKEIQIALEMRKKQSKNDGIHTRSEDQERRSQRKSRPHQQYEDVDSDIDEQPDKARKTRTKLESSSSLSLSTRKEAKQRTEATTKDATAKPRPTTKQVKRSRTEASDAVIKKKLSISEQKQQSREIVASKVGRPKMSKLDNKSERSRSDREVTFKKSTLSDRSSKKDRAGDRVSRQVTTSKGGREVPPKKSISSDRSLKRDRAQVDIVPKQATTESVSKKHSRRQRDKERKAAVELVSKKSFLKHRDKERQATAEPSATSKKRSMQRDKERQTMTEPAIKSKKSSMQREKEKQATAESLVVSKKPSMQRDKERPRPTLKQKGTTNPAAVPKKPHMQQCDKERNLSAPKQAVSDTDVCSKHRMQTDKERPTDSQTSDTDTTVPQAPRTKKKEASQDEKALSPPRREGKEESAFRRVHTADRSPDTIVTKSSTPSPTAAVVTNHHQLTSIVNTPHKSMLTKVISPSSTLQNSASSSPDTIGDLKKQQQQRQHLQQQPYAKEVSPPLSPVDQCLPGSLSARFEAVHVAGLSSRSSKTTSTNAAAGRRAPKKFFLDRRRKAEETL